MNLSQLEVLIAITDTGSLKEAGEVVSLTQSAVSYSLSRLEKELGVTLLNRGRQGIAMTRIGEEVVQHARSIMTQIDIIRQKTSRERGLSVGKLRLGYVPYIAPRLVAGIIRDFQQKYPEIEVVLFEGNPKELLGWLDTGMIDVGTVLRPEQYVSTVPLAHSEIRAILSVHHPLATESEIRMEQLAEEALIGPKGDFGTASIEIVAPYEEIVPRIRFEASTTDTILVMVRENMGVSIMPQMRYEGNLEGIVALPLAPPRSVDIFLAATIQSPVTETFLDNAHHWAKIHGFLPENT